MVTQQLHPPERPWSAPSLPPTPVCMGTHTVSFALHPISGAQWLKIWDLAPERPVQKLPLLLTGCGTSVHLSEPQFPYLYIGDYTRTQPQGFMRIKRDCVWKGLSTVPGMSGVRDSGDSDLYLPGVHNQF